jgi:hypothetical protein
MSKCVWAILAILTAAVSVQGRPPAPIAPRVGDVQRLKVITVSLQVGSTERESRQVIYSPPPGWYVRGHVVECTAKRGNSSFAVNTMPRNWNWLSEEQVKESYKALLDLAGQSKAAGFQAKLAVEQEALLKGLRRVRATHHALVVEATARGEGFLRGGGCVELTVTAEIVYIGTEESVRKLADQHRASLEKRGRPSP